MPATAVDFSLFALREDLPAHRQVAAFLKALIALGHLSTCDPLPSVPALADRLGVKPGDVRRAYLELGERGSLSREGGKWRVSDEHIVASDDDQVADLCGRLWDLIAEARQAGISRSELRRRFVALLARP